MKIPQTGMDRDALFARMDELREKDADWRGGKTFSLMYNAGHDVEEVVDQAFMRLLHSNALSLSAFPSLRRLEAEVLSMGVGLLNGGPDAAGSTTSGGTESICMSVKTAREWARAERGVDRPQMIVPASAHPAFHKAAHYFQVEPVVTPLSGDFRADVDAIRDAITDRTILLVGSAPCFPTGVVDPITDIAALAAERGILCHVDACVGGYLLPWVERLGHPVPPFDFRVPGVTQMSADLHKYGFAAKGVSTVFYRTRALRRHQFFAYVDWPGGLYASPALAGARGGGPVAGAWAVLNYLGEEGFLRLTRDTMTATAKALAGIRAIDGLSVLGDPVASVYAFTCDGGGPYVLAEKLEQRGWLVDRQQLPPSLHQMLSPYHAQVIDRYLADLAECTADARRSPPATSGVAAMYGMLAALPDRGSARRVVLDILDSFDRL